MPFRGCHGSSVPWVEVLDVQVAACLLQCGVIKCNLNPCKEKVKTFVPGECIYCLIVSLLKSPSLSVSNVCLSLSNVLSYCFRADNYGLGLFFQWNIVIILCKINVIVFTKISLSELVHGLVLLLLPIYFNALEGTTVLGITGYM